MLYQLHWQFKDGTTDMRSQREIASHDSHERNKLIHDWVAETKKDHPLPAGAQWMMCNKESKDFKGTVLI